jgi:hypothetical protein
MHREIKITRQTLWQPIIGVQHAVANLMLIEESEQCPRELEPCRGILKVGTNGDYVLLI